MIPCVQKYDKLKKIDCRQSWSHEESHPDHALIVDQMKNIFGNLFEKNWSFIFFCIHNFELNFKTLIKHFSG